MRTLAVVNLLPKAEREVALMVEALQLYGLYAEDCGIGNAPIISLAPTQLPPADVDGVLVLAEHSDAAGAAGYHFLGDDGRPMLRAFLDGTTTGELLRDSRGTGDSLLGIAQHELVEAIGDESADLYVAEPWIAPDGVKWSLRAKEHGDPVQGQCKTTTLKDGTVVDCGNFVFNAYFNPNAPKGTQLDAMRTLASPGELAHDGYQIAARITAEKDVFAATVTHRGGGPKAKAMASKKHPAARTARRLAKLQSILAPTV